MKQVPDYLDLLPQMSPVDELAIPHAKSRTRRAPWLRIRVAMIVSGFGLIFVCPWLLFFVWAYADMSALGVGERYSSLVLRRMFGLDYGGPVAIPAFLGLLLGHGLFLFGICKGQSSDPGASRCGFRLTIGQSMAAIGALAVTFAIFPIPVALYLASLTTCLILLWRTPL